MKDQCITGTDLLPCKALVKAVGDERSSVAWLSIAYPGENNLSYVIGVTLGGVQVNFCPWCGESVKLLEKVVSSNPVIRSETHGIVKSCLPPLPPRPPVRSITTAKDYHSSYSMVPDGPTPNYTPIEGPDYSPPKASRKEIVYSYKTERKPRRMPSGLPASAKDLEWTTCPLCESPLQNRNLESHQQLRCPKRATP